MFCESCDSGTAVRAVQLSLVPFAVYLCEKCCQAGVIPYSLLVTAVWLGDVDVHDPTATNIALYHGVSSAEFEADCATFADRLNTDLNDDE